MSWANSIEDWQAPSWHADLGDPKIEFEMLRDVARKASKLGLGSQIDLAIVELEPGYLELRIRFFASGREPWILIVDTGDRLLFEVVDLIGPKDDIQLSTADEVASLLSKHASKEQKERPS